MYQNSNILVKTGSSQGFPSCPGRGAVNVSGEWSAQGCRPHRTGQARSAGRKGSPCVSAAGLLSPLLSKRNAPASAKSAFSLLDRARPVFSFRRNRKEKMGGAICPAILMAESSPRPAGRKKPPPPPRFPFTNKISSYIILWLKKTERTEKRHGFD